MYIDIDERLLEHSVFNAMKANYASSCYSELEPWLRQLHVITDNGKLVSCFKSNTLNITQGSHYFGVFIYKEEADNEIKRYATLKVKRVAGSTSLVLKLHTKSGYGVGKQVEMYVANDPLNQNNSIYGFTVTQLFQIMCIYFDTGKAISEEVLAKIKANKQ